MREETLVLSIIVPVYNAEKYLAHCLDSLLAQDIDKNQYEIICVNDGSTDHSHAILQQYTKKHKNIVLINKPNGGVASARNLGLEKSRGAYVWFVDADDWIARDCLDMIKTQIDMHTPSVVQIHFDWIRAEWRVTKCAEIALDKDKVNCSMVEISADALIGVWSFIFRKELLFQNKHTFIENLHYGEDLFFVRELFDILRLETESNKVNHSVVYLQNDIFYYYRQHNESAMHISWTKNKDKYLDALIKLARMDQVRMLDSSKPKWYIDQYTELFYDRIFNYMMNWIPSVERGWENNKQRLKDEGLYPCSKPPAQIQRKLLIADGLIAKIKAAYRYYAFRFVWLYPLYYRQMKKKYSKQISQDGAK